MLQLFAFGEELGPRSGPHLAHLASCAECRQDLAIDRQLVRQLRRALRERVDGSAPSAASWERVRSRTLDREVRPWTAIVLRWGRMLPAAVACIVVFAVATAPEAGLSPGTRPPYLDASLATRALVPLEEAGDSASVQSSMRRAAEADLPPKGWATRTQTADDDATNSGEPTFPGRMR